MVKIFEGEGWLETPTPVGSIEAFYLSFLLEEFAEGGARGRGSWVRHATYWDETSATIARANYGMLEVPSIYGELDMGSHEPTQLGDDGTYILIAPVEPVFVLTRTEPAWERARELFGQPHQNHLTGPG